MTIQIIVDLENTYWTNNKKLSVSEILSILWDNPFNIKFLYIKNNNISILIKKIYKDRTEWRVNNTWLYFCQIGNAIEREFISLFSIFLSNNILN